MIANFNGIFYLVVFLLVMSINAFYAYNTLFNTKNFIFNSFKIEGVIFPFNWCWGSSFSLGLPLHPIINTMGIEYTSGWHMDIKGFIAFPIP